MPRVWMRRLPPQSSASCCKLRAAPQNISRLRNPNAGFAAYSPSESNPTRRENAMRFTQRIFHPALAAGLAGLMLTASGFAASHREAPITALDQKADITDWFTFVSPEHPDKVIMILNVDPFLEPSNGPNYFP